MTYVTVNSANGFWEFTRNSYTVRSDAFVSLSIDAVADTGTTLFLLPQHVITAYYKKVAGAIYCSLQGGYIFTYATTPPSITLGSGTYKAAVPGSYLNYAPVSSTSCYGGVQSKTGLGFSIFGVIFLKSQFVVFKGNTCPIIGFAAKPN